MIKLLNEYIQLLLKFLKPKLVLAANAEVSHYLTEHFNDDKEDCTFIQNEKTNCIRIFLASMLTGVRAMDTFSRKRLFNEIQEFISKG